MNAYNLRQRADKLERLARERGAPELLTQAKELRAQADTVAATAAVAAANRARRSNFPELMLSRAADLEEISLKVFRRACELENGGDKDGGAALWETASEYKRLATDLRERAASITQSAAEAPEPSVHKAIQLARKRWRESVGLS